MCGRVLYNYRPDEIAELLELVEPFEMEPRYNLAPTDPIPIVSTWGRVEVTRWGLSLSNPRAQGFNAKSENLGRLYARTERALVVVAGFYEWRTRTPGARPSAMQKQPFLVRRADGAPLVLAGLRDETGAAIVTAPARGLVAGLHDRMPVVLERSTLRAWLDPSANARDITRAASSASLTMHPVSNDVGNVKNDGPRLMDAVDELPIQAERSQLALFAPDPPVDR